MVLLPGQQGRGAQQGPARLGLSHNTVGVGDAESDHAFLRLCECSVAVANALEMVKATADFVAGSEHSAGVTELSTSFWRPILAS